NFLAEFRKHGRSSASCGFLDHIVSLGVKLKSRIRTRQPVRYPALLVIEFRNNEAGIRKHLLSRRPSEVGASHEGFGQVDGIVDDDRPGQEIAVTIEVLRQLRLVAAWYAIAPDPSRFQMRGCDF